MGEQPKAACGRLDVRVVGLGSNVRIHGPVAGPKASWLTIISALTVIGVGVYLSVYERRAATVYERLSKAASGAAELIRIFGLTDVLAKLTPAPRFELKAQRNLKTDDPSKRN